MDCFDGFWFFLNDGQPLSVYLVEESEEYNVYTSPVLLNGEETYLRILMKFREDGSYGLSIVGAWSGIDEETGESSRNIKKLRRGDVINPGHYTYGEWSGEDGLQYGEDYVYTGNSRIYEKQLQPAYYYYCFEIHDVFGGILYTDYVTFGIDENGELYYYE